MMELSAWLGVIRDWVKEKLNFLAEHFKMLFLKVPIFGKLITCRAEDHLSTWNEIFYNFIFATMPFWLGAILTYIYVSVNQTQELIDLALLKSLLISGLSNGELLVFSTSFLAPVMYLLLQDPKVQSKEFPSKTLIGFLTVLIIIITTAIFAALKVNSSANKELVLIISFITAAIALALRYIATVYHKYRHGDPEDLIKSGKQFTDELRGHR